MSPDLKRIAMNIFLAPVLLLSRSQFVQESVPRSRPKSAALVTEYKNRRLCIRYVSKPEGYPCVNATTRRPDSHYEPRAVPTRIFEHLDARHGFLPSQSFPSTSTPPNSKALRATSLGTRLLKPEGLTPNIPH